MKYSEISLSKFLNIFIFCFIKGNIFETFSFERLFLLIIINNPLINKFVVSILEK